VRKGRKGHTSYPVKRKKKGEEGKITKKREGKTPARETKLTLATSRGKKEEKRLAFLLAQEKKKKVRGKVPHSSPSEGEGDFSRRGYRRGKRVLEEKAGRDGGANSDKGGGGKQRSDVPFIRGPSKGEKEGGKAKGKNEGAHRGGETSLSRAPGAGETELSPDLG